VFRVSLLSNPLLISAIVMSQIVHIGATHTPWISDVLALQPVSVQEWLVLLGVSLVLLAVEELHKWSYRWRLAARARQSTA